MANFEGELAAVESAVGAKMGVHTGVKEASEGAREWPPPCERGGDALGDALRDAVRGEGQREAALSASSCRGSPAFQSITLELSPSFTPSSAAKPWKMAETWEK